MDYKNQYLHPEWQKKRLQVMEMYNFRCQLCDDDEKTLNVHHPVYKKGAKVWEYKTEALMCLCQDCHTEEHELVDEMLSFMSENDTQGKKVILGMLKADVPIIRPKNGDEAYGYWLKLLCNIDGFEDLFEGKNWFSFTHKFWKEVKAVKHRENEELLRLAIDHVNTKRCE